MCTVAKVKVMVTPVAQSVFLFAETDRNGSKQTVLCFLLKGKAVGM